ncbi:MAG: YidC/Oxa1 family membrane protein insertase, partial [Clostridia bacterium]|nr:YidC/Oxa1 family membrane protein insertase [Clostridia bacterium]
MLEIISLMAPESGNIFVQIIKWLVSISGSVALGIVLFTVLLKLITFPFDLFSRISMKKNSIKMEAMRPELEKLQKQYANNKEMYNQKMAALYKKNGYSMAGACFPMIASIVIFIIAINGFTDYGKYQNTKYFYDMAKSYNSVVYDSFVVDNDLVSTLDDGTIKFNDEKILKLVKNVGETKTTDTYTLTNKTGPDGKGIITFQNKNGYVRYEKYYNLSDKKTFAEKDYFYLDITNLTNLKDASGNGFTGTTLEEGIAFVNGIRQEKAANTFRTENGKFLWVKNIWVKDSPMAHPVNSDVQSFNSEQGRASCDCSGEVKEIVNESAYNELTAKLEFEKEAPNGYFILCLLTAGISFLMQFITNKTQKAQMDFQTVDGQGAGNRKMMTIMMPIMMAIFSFLYTAAFSIYIIISSVISIINTLLINWIVQKKYDKKESEKDTGVIRGRVYVPEEQPKEEKKKKE